MILRQTLRRTFRISRRCFSEFGILTNEDVHKAVVSKSVKVAVLGADTPVGFYTTFLLKQNPLISHLYLFGSGRVICMADDLKSMDTKSKITASYTNEELPGIVRGADIIALMGMDTLSTQTHWLEIFYNEGRRLINLTEVIIKYNPKAIVLVCATPVSCTLPLVSSVFRRTPWYHPGKIIGSPMVPVTKANAVLGIYNELDPEVIHTPVTGGPDMDCAVPLFAQGYPVECWESEERALCCKFKELDEQDCPITTQCYVKPPGSYLMESFGISRLISLIGLGYCGDTTALSRVFIRQSFIPSCKYLTCTVQLGRDGVIHNFGVPFLTNFELQFLERMVLVLAHREYVAEEFLRKEGSYYTGECQN
ncbi:malate dehydrogenase, mitochondrial-like [Agrilus planipennis]|uniref:malate dehydrogenase n=1 Tax=Agrilus planipennis TaxID=224129 RepID=A0A1W4XJ58_AGRPL|nr:malate dehydrogenase, mitochondrial-like [Agrilus planipennis]